MLKPFLRKLRKQLFILAAVAVVLLAAYVSIGRQFMPAISEYRESIEQRLSELAGLPVSIESVSGSFIDFNPVVEIGGLTLDLRDPSSEDEPIEALYFENALLILDVPKSLWRRQWTLLDFQIDSLRLNVEQDQSGSWQLRGLDGQLAASGEDTDFATLYNSLLRVNQLDLLNVVIGVENREGNRYLLRDGVVRIRNAGARHLLQLDAYLDGNRAEISASMELRGNRFDLMNGQLHIDVPVDNYSSFINGVNLGELRLEELVGGVESWIDIERGKAVAVTAQPQISRLAVSGGGQPTTVIQQLTGSLRGERDQQTGRMKLQASDMSISSAGINWLRFNAFADYQPEQSFELRADSVNLDFLAGFALSSGLINADARGQLEQYDPGGRLQNLQLDATLDGNSLSTLSLATNILDGEAHSVRGSPNMWGIDGYVELEFDADAKLIRGLGEVDSTDYSMNIPNVFTSRWDFSRVSGALDFRVDLSNGQDVTLSSGVIVAESDAVDGHAQFRSILRRFPDDSRDAELELMVGASRFDGAQKSLFLPDGPNVDGNLRGTMQWLETAVQGADVDNAGVVFRGSTLPGSSDASKTFQSYYQMREANLEYSPEWPPLETMTALVFTDDNNIDVEVTTGSSMGLELQSAIGRVRRNEAGQNWLHIEGDAGGATAAGLEFLRAAPLGDGLKSTLGSWQAEGPFAATLQVDVPLSPAGLDTEVRIDMQLDNNSLMIGDYDLPVNDLSGQVLFDTRSGLEPSQLTGSLFGGPASISLGSSMVAGELESILVSSRGRAGTSSLADWSQQSGFVRGLLAQASGDFSYEAQLRVPQGEAATSESTTLQIGSDLQGVALAFPNPYAKSAEQSRALDLKLEFGESQTLTGSFGSDLVLDLGFPAEGRVDGLVAVGESTGALLNPDENDPDGLLIRGQLASLEVEQWAEFIEGLSMAAPVSPGVGAVADQQASEQAAASFAESLAFVDLSIAQLSLYQQPFANVNLRIEPVLAEARLNAWLDSADLAGRVGIPFASDDYLLVDLDYLTLPDTEPEAEPRAPASVPADLYVPEEERVDVLAGVDPRELPRLRLVAREFNVGQRPYGSWQFQLDPFDGGAEFTDLRFDFRGLRLATNPGERLGLPEFAVQQDAETPPANSSSQPTPSFTWAFDGDEHHSYLRGVLSASNMADLLLANGFAAAFTSQRASFDVDIDWPGSPAFFAGSDLSGDLAMSIENGRFLEEAGASGALKLISILNFDALMRRLRFSDDLLRRGLAYDEISAQLQLENGLVDIQDRLVIEGPSSLYQITGVLDLENETIDGELFVTLPVSDNIPWLGLLTANIPIAVGAYLFDQIFGSQVDSLTSAVYTLEGPWEGLQPQFKQAFGSPEEAAEN